MVILMSDSTVIHLPVWVTSPSGSRVRVRSGGLRIGSSRLKVIQHQLRAPIVRYKTSYCCFSVSLTRTVIKVCSFEICILLPCITLLTFLKNSISKKRSNLIFSPWRITFLGMCTTLPCCFRNFHCPPHVTAKGLVRPLRKNRFLINFFDRMGPRD